MSKPLPPTSTLDDPGLRSRARALRAKGCSPKAIARALNLRPADAAHLVRELAAETETSPPEPELVGCWVSPGWSSGLLFERRPDWPDQPDFEPPDGTDAELAVLVSVLVARRDHRRRLSVCGYLVDTGCLGIKNAVGPVSMPDRRLLDFVGLYFQAYEAPPLRAPLSLAQQLLYGAEQYARGLGFEPHPDYAATKGHLGEWSGSCDITFGVRGKPFYVEGPYDDATSVVHTLDRTVGKGGYGHKLISPFMDTLVPPPLALASRR